jgi:hypothetical protein
MTRGLLSPEVPNETICGVNMNAISVYEGFIGFEERRELELRIASPGLTLDDAFAIAIRLESSEINDVYNTLTAPIQGSAYVLRKTFRPHLDRLPRSRVMIWPVAMRLRGSVLGPTVRILLTIDRRSLGG